MSYTPEEPIAAIATALAPSALGIIRVSGKNSITLISNVFSRPKALLQAEGNTMVYGWIINPANNKEKIDEVMLGVYRAPKSFTGEDMVEIFCHGGTSPVLAIYNLLIANGFRPAEKGEYSFRAFINGKTDLTKAEAVREIIDSKTDAGRQKAAGRLSGSLFTEIDNIKKMLISTLAEIEAEIEYPEDEEAIADSYNPEHLIDAQKELISLASTWDCEKLYQDGAKIVLCGATNAGKSSLFNIMLKEDRSIVSDIHGTTRDWIESWISFDGVPARLFDTAGLRETEDTVEQIGVERTLELTEDADLILYLIDSTKGPSKDDEQMITKLLQKNSNTPVILAWNKIDLTPEYTKYSEMIPHKEKLFGTVGISAKKGLGVSDLTGEVKKALTIGLHTDSNQTGLGSERQKKAVEEALDSINHALIAPQMDLPMDAVIQDIEDAISFLGEITGEVSPDDILGNIFSRFCVGK
jgi:tRNA modification GTPase